MTFSSFSSSSSCSCSFHTTPGSRQWGRSCTLVHAFVYSSRSAVTTSYPSCTMRTRTGQDRPGQARTGIYTIDLVKFKLQHSKIDFVFALVQLFSPQIFFSMAHCALLILQFALASSSSSSSPSSPSSSYCLFHISPGSRLWGRSCTLVRFFVYFHARLVRHLLLPLDLGQGLVFIKSTPSPSIRS